MLTPDARKPHSEPQSPAHGLAHPFRWSSQCRNASVSVSGRLPSWLQGLLVRTCSAVFSRDQWSAEHWFDGLGLFYSFELDAPTGGVRFQQRLLASRAAEAAAHGRSDQISFGTAMTRGFWRRILEPIPPQTDNANVNVIPWQGKWLAMTETRYQYLIDPADLSTAGPYRYDDDLPSDLSMSPHPHYDCTRDALVNVGWTFGRKSELWIYRQGADSRARVVEGRLPCSRFPYTHSFGMSPNHVVLIDQPFRFNPLAILFSNRPYAEHFKWRPDTGTTLWKLERSSGRFTRHETEAFFCFHVVNQFEDGADVVLDLVAYTDPSVVEQFKLAHLQDGQATARPRFVRARLVPGNCAVQLEQLSEQSFELPQIAYQARQGRHYGVVWGAQNARDDRGAAVSALVRVEIDSGRVVRFAEEDLTFGEPVFVGRPGGEPSEDGVLLAVGSYASRERSVLLIVDARTLEPIARAEVDVALPLGFHGSFAPRHGRALQTH